MYGIPRFCAFFAVVITLMAALFLSGRHQDKAPNFDKALTACAWSQPCNLTAVAAIHVADVSAERSVVHGDRDCIPAIDCDVPATFNLCAQSNAPPHLGEVDISDISFTQRPHDVWICNACADAPRPVPESRLCVTVLHRTNVRSVNF